MTDPWFNPNYWGWLPGTFLGCFAGLWGALAGTFAPRGKGRSLILGFGLLLFGLSMSLLTAGLTALASGQPEGVWYSLGLAGLIGVAVIGPMLPVVRNRYREAEERRMQAQDLL